MPRNFDIEFMPSSNILKVDYELIPFEAMPSVKSVKYIGTTGEFKETPILKTQMKQNYESMCYQVTLRTIYEIFDADQIDAVDAVSFNGWVKTRDVSTGQLVSPCIMSLLVEKTKFSEIDIEHVVPKECFKKLKGVSGSSLQSMVAIKPIMQIDKSDKRFIDGKAVIDDVSDGYNLAEMDWQDFENLIRELFQKEFAKSGGDVKVTQASRDGGVDAIAFDPDPIRGGKMVIQAKRYTNTVTVAAVRDLYGTLVSEGATKGILITTSDYGPDSYEFAKGKPLTLLNGGHLMYMMKQYGYNAIIDLESAKANAKNH